MLRVFVTKSDKIKQRKTRRRSDKHIVMNKSHFLERNVCLCRLSFSFNSFQFRFSFFTLTHVPNFSVFSFFGCFVIAAAAADSASLTILWSSTKKTHTQFTWRCQKTRASLTFMSNHSLMECTKVYSEVIRQWTGIENTNSIIQAIAVIAHRPKMTLAIAKHFPIILWATMYRRWCQRCHHHHRQRQRWKKSAWTRVALKYQMETSMANNDWQRQSHQTTY